MRWWRRRNPEAPKTPLERLEERLSAYLDGEMTDAERQEVERELAVSPEAQERLAGLRLARDLLAGLGTVHAPRSFAIQAAPAVRPARLFYRMEIATRMGAAAAALLFVVAIVNPTGGSESADTITAATFSLAQAPATEALQAAEAAAGDSAKAAPAPVLASPSPESTPLPSPRTREQNAASTDNAATPEAGGGSAEATPAPAATGPEAAPTGSPAESAPPSAATPDEAGAARAAPVQEPSGVPQPADAAGTFAAPAASHLPSGVATGLAVLTLLMLALSLLLAWTRRRTANG